VYERYRVHVHPVAPRSAPVPKFVIVRAGNCMNCGKCERACVYGVHKRREDDPRRMDDPLSQFCKNCFRCIGECPQRALTIALNPEFQGLGHGLWTPQRVSTMWSEAETGKIPVFGAGYRGLFAGPGYDSMWTDMSEIVRPTRDGIHGREFISTSVDLGRKAPWLEFDSGRLRTKVPDMITLPGPFLLDLVRLKVQSPSLLAGMEAAAADVGTMVLVPSDQVPMDAPKNIIPVITASANVAATHLPDRALMVELERTGDWRTRIEQIRSRCPRLIVSLRAPSSEEVENELGDIATSVDVLHLTFGDDGAEPSGRHARDALRQIHRRLVKMGRRDEITIIAGGGIAAAEHVPKSIICGADAVCLEEALLVALECRACASCDGNECALELKNAPIEFVRGRVTNMCGAWRDQMLEVLGAMGIREVRRLRGETGRAIFQEDAEREAFSGMEGGDANG
jgi:ferredoxin